MTMLEAHNLSHSYRSGASVGPIDLTVPAGGCLGLVGANGAGKTTFFNCLTGMYKPTEGQVSLFGTQIPPKPRAVVRAGMARTFQNIRLFGNMTALENVMVGRHLHESHNVFAHLLALPGVRRQNRETRQKAEALLERVGLASLASHPAGALPYGALKRLEIARALATEPRVLLLDEPAAGCNPVEASELEGIVRGIARDGVTVVLVEHNMRLVMNLSDRIHVLANGRTLAEGTATEVRNNPAVIEAYLGSHAQDAAHAGH